MSVWNQQYMDRLRRFPTVIQDFKIGESHGSPLPRYLVFGGGGERDPPPVLYFSLLRTYTLTKVFSVVFLS
jgi:hypothetical protein